MSDNSTQNSVLENQIEVNWDSLKKNSKGNADFLEIIPNNSDLIIKNTNLSEFIESILTFKSQGFIVLQEKNVLEDDFSHLFDKLEKEADFELKPIQYKEFEIEPEIKHQSKSQNEENSESQNNQAFYSFNEIYEKVWNLGVFIINNHNAQSSLVQGFGVIYKIFVWFKTFVFNGKKTENAKIKCKFIIKTMIGSSQVIREIEFEGNEKDFVKWEKKQLKKLENK